LEPQELQPPDQFDEKYFVDDAIWQAQEQAFTILEAHSEQPDDNLFRRIKTLKRQLGIQQTA